MAIRNTCFQLAVLALSLVAVSGCQKPEAASRDHLAKGDAFLAEKKYNEAEIEYRNVLQLTPMAMRAHFGLGEVLAARSDVRGALGAYVRAADLDPGFVDAQMKASNLLLLARQYDAARIRLRAVLEKEPDNASALLMLGNAMAGLGSIEEALAANRRAIALDPKRAGMYFNLGALQYRQGDKAEAEASFKAAVAAEPKSLNARIGLADFYALEGRQADAETAYKEALAIDAKNLAANRAIAGFYIRSDRLREAEVFLKGVAENAKTAGDWYALTDYYVVTRQKKKALQILAGLRTEAATYEDATIKIAFLAAADRQNAQALRLVDEIITKDPRHASALALKAHLYLAMRKRTDALATAEKAVTADNKSQEAHYAHAIAAEANGKRDVAKAALLEVLKLNATSTDALLELAKLHLEQNLIPTALQFAEQAVKANPRLIEAQLMRLRIMANSADYSKFAGQELAALVAKYPRSAEVQYEAGRAALVQKNSAQASKYFIRARELDPNDNRVLIELVKLEASEGRMPQVKRLADEALAKDPESIELLLVAGTTYGMIDAAGSERHLRKVLELDPENLTAYQGLAALYLTRNQLERAKEEFITLSKKTPTAIAPPTMVGIISEAQGNPTEAQRWYEQVLRINGRASTAANNLAWIYAERGDKLDLAIELAQTAHQQLPRQAEVTDTLGFAYLKKGSLTMAVRTLQDAVAQDASNAVYHYHLGLAYSQSGEDARARTSLQKALTLNPKFKDAADAHRALAKLLY